MSARYERLKKELELAELELDRLSRTLDVGLMRTQQRVAGQRAKVFGLRLEIRTVDLAKLEKASDQDRRDLQAEIAGLRLGIKESDLTARAASKQAIEDELPELMRRLNEADDLQGDFAGLH